MFISKNETFNKTSLGVEQLSQWYGCTLHTAEKPFVIEVLLIDWQQNALIQKVGHRRERAQRTARLD
jgi:hypothetical protein